MTAQPSLFAELPRRKPRKLMHVVDAGNGAGCCVVKFECGYCGFRSDWVEQRTVTEEKRGRPCPQCNE